MSLAHDWAVFLAPGGDQTTTYASNEPYYFERNNQITTWIRPFDYRDVPLSKGESWQQAEAERKLQLARSKAKEDRPMTQTAVRGSEQWRVVTTVQGREYYHDVATGVSQWSRPAELDEIASEEDNEDEEQQGVVDGTEMTAEDAEWMLAQMDEDGEDDDDDDKEEEEVVEEVADLPKDERIAQFKAMLLDIGVNAF
ncbi:hypothetical protein GGI21_006106, partial [Coemansia aciculifera]